MTVTLVQQPLVTPGRSKTRLVVQGIVLSALQFDGQGRIRHCVMVCWQKFVSPQSSR